MSQPKLATLVFITAAFCCSEAVLDKIFECFFNTPLPSEDHGLSFSETFKIALASNDQLQKQFNVSIPPKECYDVVHALSLDFYTKVHADDPLQIADDLAEFSEYKYQGLPPKDMANMVMKSVEQVLTKQGALNEANGIPLALKFVHYLNSLRNSPHYDGTPTANLATLYYGVLDLFQDVIPDAPNNGKIISETFEENVKALPDSAGHPPTSKDAYVDVSVNTET